MIMDLPTVKHSGGKTDPNSDLWAGATLEDTKQKANCNNFEVLQRNAGGLNQAKERELHHKILEHGEMVSFLYWKPV
jgi:hypothetical protein